MNDESSIPVVSGYAVIDKPSGITSYRLLQSMGNKLDAHAERGARTKCGHAGTLDSFASGVLVCLFGRYTRLSDFFMGAGKGYEADILFGEETDTLDPEGQVVATGPLPSIEAIRAALPAFTGDIMQAPPAYSAVHIDGQRAYERVRKGQDVSPALRPVTISSLGLVSYENGIGRISVACAKGTYIRSLARDLGLACGSRARLAALRRTFSGPFGIDGAVSADSFCASDIRVMSEQDASGLGLGSLRLGAEEAKAFSTGLPLFRLASFTSLAGIAPVSVFDGNGSLLGIVMKSGSAWRYAFVLGASD